MNEELRRRLDLSSGALRKLSRLNPEQWLSRDKLFGDALPDDVEWQDTMLKKFVREHVLEQGNRRNDRAVLYRVSHVPDRLHAVAVLTGVLDDLSVLRPVIWAQASSVKKNPLTQPVRLLIEVPAPLHEKIKERAYLRNQKVTDYVLSLIYADGVTLE